MSPQLSFENKKQGWIGDNPKIILDVNEIKKIGWKPYTTVEEAVRLTVNFLVNNKWVFKNKIEKNILIIGGSGHLGSFLVNNLIYSNNLIVLSKRKK